jgi:signal transduction histidine kinase
MRLRSAATHAHKTIGSRQGDAALAILLAVFAEVEVWLGDGYVGPRWANALLVLVMALPLAWRRRAPLVVLAIVMGGLAVQSIAFGGSETGSLLLMSVVAVYSAAAHSSRPLVAAAVGWAGAIVHDVFDPEIDRVTEAIYSSLAFGFVFLFGLAMRVRQSRTAAVEARARTLEAEHERARAGAAAERRRIANELHDIVAHSLGMMVLQAGAAEQVLETSPEKAREALRSIRLTGQEAVDEMARLLGLIRDERSPGLSPQPRLADVDTLVHTARATGLEVELSVEGEPHALPAAVELSAFRVVQEGITNALKHSGAERAQVAIRYREQELEVEVADDGTGSPDGYGGGYGLAGLRERVAVFGGRLEAGRAGDAGWTLRAVLPVDR